MGPFRGSTTGILAACVVLATMGCASEAIYLKPIESTETESVAEGPVVRVAESAEGVPELIGRSTVTLFAIPASKLRAEGGPERIMAAFARSLESAGYRPEPTSQSAPRPRLTCQVSKLRFSSYSWFFPAIITSGQIELSLALVDEAGKALWSKSYATNCKKTTSGDTFDRRVNEAFHTILAEAEKDFGSEAFREACCSSPGAS